MRKYEQYTTETLVKKVLIHGHLTGYRKMPIDLESDEYYKELLAEIKARIAEGGEKDVEN